jgi:hypothetical protein
VFESVDSKTKIQFRKNLISGYQLALEPGKGVAQLKRIAPQQLIARSSNCEFLIENVDNDQKIELRRLSQCESNDSVVEGFYVRQTSKKDRQPAHSR